MSIFKVYFMVSPNTSAGSWSSMTRIEVDTSDWDRIITLKSDNKFILRAYYMQAGTLYKDLYTRTATAKQGYELESITGFISGLRIYEDITVVANFKKNTWTTRYFKNLGDDTKYLDENVSAPYYVKYLSAIGWSTDNYTFNTWNTDANGSGVSYKPGTIFRTRPGNQLDLYAQWTPKNYRISFSHNAGGTTDLTGSHTWAYGSTHTVYGIPSQDYYYLDHWEVTGYDDGSTKTWDPDPGNAFNFTVYGNRTIKAIFEKKSYTLSVKASPSTGGTVGGGGTAKYGSYLNIFANANLGYKFDHWDGTDGGYGTGASRNVKIVENTTYTAYFTPKTYTVKINTNGGKWLEDEPESTFTTGNNIKTFDTPAQLMSNVPYRFGYQFSGWGWRKDNTGDFTYIYKKGGTFDDKAYTDLGGTTTQITLYAVWTPIKNTIKYHYYIGDTSSDVEIIDTDTYTIETPNPYKYYDPKNQRGENSTFLGWARVKPDNWGEASQEGHGNYPVPSNVPVLYNLPYEVNISNIKDTTQDNKQWGTTVDVYGFWTVTGKYININGTWKKVNTAYVRTDTGWKVITDMYINISDDPDNPNWKHEVII